ncbi:MAG: hypothetical protein B6229_01230 [Spirochaetaceae bacterium 4572_7]|nr:MAG: hypothetical protein B6229_01230 [Spirochaetaceae bacterium 4572_7]
MKFIYYIILLFIPTLIFSQELTEIKSENFIFETAQSKDAISEIVDFCEELNKKLNLELKLKNNNNSRRIVILTDKNSYDNYLELLNITPREDFTYANFEDNNRDRVILYLGKANWHGSLAHHLTLQYMDFYGSGAPYWFNLGIATYFDSVDREKKLVIQNISKETLFNNNIEDSTAWLLFDFLFNTNNKEYNRLLWDSLSMLKYSDIEDKEKIINDGFKELSIDIELKNYYANIKGYSDYIEQGIDFYQKNDYKNAISNLTIATELKPKMYSPDYYLGLCYSRMEKYEKAYSHFSLAMEKGADNEITLYSIGVNFYAQKNMDLAKKYLNMVIDFNGKYTNKAELLLNEIKKY